MKRVLFLAQIFPPSGGAGVQRSAKFVKYLPQFGWQPVVITRSEVLGAVDPSMAADVETCEVHRLRGWGLPERWRGKRGARSLALRLFSWLSVPDAGAWWIPSALMAARRSLRNRGAQMIFATGGPFSTLIFGVALQRLTGLPLVVDLRDPWTGNPRRLPRRWHVFWRDPLERAAERFCLRRAERVICVNREMVELLELHNRASVEVVENGYDPDDFGPPPEPSPDAFVFSYVGSLLPEFRVHEWFFPAFQEFERELDSRSRPSSLRWTGDLGGADLPAFVASQARVDGYICHQEAVASMQSASALLLFSGGHDHDLSGKVFEYLATGKPILAFVSKTSAAAKLLGRYPQTYVVPPFDHAAAVSALRSVYSDGRAVERSTTVLQRRERTHELAAIFDRLVGDVEESP